MTCFVSRWFGLVNSVEQFSTVMRDQLDFRIEAGHLSRFRANFQNDDRYPM
jgi:predicted unusual protein kinase regulating ubiquinone biosynthesis (AarF/ABC1/UbiB family)